MYVCITDANITSMFYNLIFQWSSDESSTFLPELFSPISNKPIFGQIVHSVASWTNEKHTTVSISTAENAVLFNWTNKTKNRRRKKKIERNLDF